MDINTQKNTYKSPEDIKEDLKKISPLALPDYLCKCEFYDKTRAFEILEQAEREFKDKGGIASSLFDTTLHAVVNSVGLCLLRKFHNETYRKVVKSKSTDFSMYAKNAFTFEYPETVVSSASSPKYAVDSLEQDILRRNMSHYPGDGTAPQLDMAHYDGGKNYRDKSSAKEYLERQSSDGKTVRGMNGDSLSIHKKDIQDRSQRAEADHIIPLQTIHNERKYFIERYVDLDKKDANGRTVLQQIVNDDKNFQVLSGDKNASKGGGLTNLRYIEYLDRIEKASVIKRKMETASPAEKEKLQEEMKELHLSKTQKDAARMMANEENLSPEESKALNKYRLTDKEKEQLSQNQKEAEAYLQKEFLKQGTGTVLMEQIGKIIEIIVGPIGFELRDSIKNGITYGFEDCNLFEAFCKRLWRALQYTFSRLGDLLKNFVKDLAKMISTFFLAACKALQSFFGKFFDLALGGISVIIDAIEILLGSGTAKQKGDAILKVIVGFATGILGQFVIDALLESLGLPDPFSDIAAAIISATISALVMNLFDKLNLFGIKRELRIQRIEELFALRKQEILEASYRFEKNATEAIIRHRVAMENLRMSLDEALAAKDFSLIDDTLDDICEMFGVDVPYQSPAEFIQLLQKNMRCFEIA